MEQIKFVTEKSARIDRLIKTVYENMPVIEADRAELVTESYKATENLPIIKRRSAAFSHILKNIPITIREDELIVGSNSLAPHGCQIYPEYSCEWIAEEFDTFETREADPFYISEDTKKRLAPVCRYWKGKTVSDLARANMAPEAYSAFTKHNVFTVGNYFYNGVGHINVDYNKVMTKGLSGIIEEAESALSALKVTDGDYADRRAFLEAVIESCSAVVLYARRYAAYAAAKAAECRDPERRAELLKIAENCRTVPEKPAEDFWQACQSFWFIQQLLQLESNGHSISPGRFDQYMYPFYKADLDLGRITRESAQELLDCIWVKFNDLNKVRDAASSKGFAGYGLFQNLIVGGQNEYGFDATNDLSYMCLEAAMHVRLPQPSLSIRVWNGSPESLLLKAAALTRIGTGLPAYYNDEIIIPAIMKRGLTLGDARDYCIIGCVEPQKGTKTDGWHDAAFFNMCRPLELVFKNGFEMGEQIGLKTGDVSSFKTYEQFVDAYKKQSDYMVGLLVNADNAVDAAHAARCPLPFESCLVDSCIQKGKSIQEGGAHYNFTGPQGFGIANMTDALIAVKKYVYDEKRFTLSELKNALDFNFGKGMTAGGQADICLETVSELLKNGITPSEEDIEKIAKEVKKQTELSPEMKVRFEEIHELIENAPKYGNDDETVDLTAREVAYIYTKEVEKYKNHRGGNFQAGLYPVSANVPLGEQTGATPDGRYAQTPIADGVGPAAGRDTLGPTAAANSVAKLDHGIASNGTLFNQKFHPSALAGEDGLKKFVALIRGFFDQKGMHMQFNVVSRETLLDAQAHPENYKNLVVRVAGYSALFTTLSRSLQDDIISRTTQGW